MTVRRSPLTQTVLARSLGADHAAPVVVAPVVVAPVATAAGGGVVVAVGVASVVAVVVAGVTGVDARLSLLARRWIHGSVGADPGPAIRKRARR